MCMHKLGIIDTALRQAIRLLLLLRGIILTYPWAIVQMHNTRHYSVSMFLLLIVHYIVYISNLFLTVALGNIPNCTMQVLTTTNGSMQLFFLFLSVQSGRTLCAG